MCRREPWSGRTAHGTITVTGTATNRTTGSTGSLRRKIVLRSGSGRTAVSRSQQHNPCSDSKGVWRTCKMFHLSGSKRDAETCTHNSTQLNTPHHNTTQHNSTQLDTTQLNTTQNNSTQHDTIQHNTTQLNATQLNSTQHNSTQHNTT